MYNSIFTLSLTATLIVALERAPGLWVSIQQRKNLDGYLWRKFMTDIFHFSAVFSVFCCSFAVSYTDSEVLPIIWAVSLYIGANACAVREIEMLHIWKAIWSQQIKWIYSFALRFVYVASTIGATVSSFHTISYAYVETQSLFKHRVFYLAFIFPILRLIISIIQVSFAIYSCTKRTRYCMASLISAIGGGFQGGGSAYMIWGCIEQVPLSYSSAGQHMLQALVIIVAIDIVFIIQKPLLARLKSTSNVRQALPQIEVSNEHLINRPAASHPSNCASKRYDIFQMWDAAFRECHV